MNQTHFHFLTGAGLGMSTAVIGALVDWLRMRRLPDPNNGRLPGCLLLAAGALGVLGVFMIIAAWLLTGSPHIAFHAGAGVITGFFLGFVFLSALWLLREYRRARKLGRK